MIPNCEQGRMMLGARNECAVLGAVIGEVKPKQVVEATGLAESTVRIIMRRLTRDGLLTRLPKYFYKIRDI